MDNGHKIDDICICDVFSMCVCTRVRQNLVSLKTDQHSGKQEESNSDSGHRKQCEIKYHADSNYVYLTLGRLQRFPNDS